MVPFKIIDVAFKPHDDDRYVEVVESLEAKPTAPEELVTAVVTAYESGWAIRIRGQRNPASRSADYTVEVERIHVNTTYNYVSEPDTGFLQWVVDMDTNEVALRRGYLRRAEGAGETKNMDEVIHLLGTLQIARPKGE